MTFVKKITLKCEEQFLKLKIHTMTLELPDGKTKIQVDHIIINGKCKSSQSGVCVSDIDRDHSLLIGKLVQKQRHPSFDMY